MIASSMIFGDSHYDEDNRPSIIYEEEQNNEDNDNGNFNKEQSSESSVSAGCARNVSPQSLLSSDINLLVVVKKEEEELQHHRQQQEEEKEDVEDKEHQEQEEQKQYNKKDEEYKQRQKNISHRKLVVERRQQQQKKQRQKMKMKKKEEEKGEEDKEHLQQQKKNNEEDTKKKKETQQQQKSNYQPKVKPKQGRESKTKQNQEEHKCQDQEQATGWSHDNNNNAFADSPYFNAFVEKELNSLKLNADIMKEIACKSSNFSDAGKAMAKAARELSMSCRFIKSTEYRDDNENTTTPATPTVTIDKEELSLRVKTVGIKSATILKHFATILEDIAGAQEKIANAVEASLGSHIAENAMSQVKRANVYKDEATKQSEEAENNLFDYLNNKYGETVTTLNNNDIPASFSSYLSSSPIIITTTASSSLSSTANSSKYNNKDRIGMMSRTPSTRNIVMNSNTHTYRGGATNTASRASMMNKSLSVRGDMMSRTPSIRGGNMISRTSSIGGRSMMNKSLSIRDISNKQTTPSPSIMNSLKKTMSFRWTVNSEERNDAMTCMEDSLPEGSTNLSPFATTISEDSCPGCNKTTPEVEKQQKSDNILNNKAIKMANLKYNLEQIRVDQATAQLRRFRLSGLFVEASYKQDIKLGQNIYKAMNEMQSSYKSSFDALIKILPRTKKLAKDVVRTQQSNIIGWKEGEKKIVEIVNNFKSHAMESYEEVEAVEEEVAARTFNSSGGCYCCNNIRNNKSSNMFIDPNMLTQEVLLLKENCRLWSSLPMALATTASYPRTKPPGVIVEGWVYENITSPGMIMMTTKSQWVRSWFMLKDDGIIYSLQSKPERTSDYQCCTYKGKVCNVVLCAIQQQQQDRHLHLVHQDLTNNNDSNNCGSNNNIVNNNGYVDSNSDQRFCFKLMAPDVKDPITIKTIGPHDLLMWLNGIKSSIMDQLSRGRGGEIGGEEGSIRGLGTSISTYIVYHERQLSSEVENTFLDITSSSLYNSSNNKKRKEAEKESKNNGRKNNDKSNTVIRSSSDNIKKNSSKDAKKKRNNIDLWNRVREANSTCADCGKASPDWVSLNFGILICINCSGVHRSLGTHMSKVRSLSLDSLSDREALLVLALGNDHMNKIFEKKYVTQITTNSSSSNEEKDADDDNNSDTIHEQNEKPVITEHTDRVELEEWIKRKYVAKEFLFAGPGDENYEGEMIDHRDKESKDLYDASCSLNIDKLAYGIAIGADVNWKCNRSRSIVAGDDNDAASKGVVEEGLRAIPVEHDNSREKEATIYSSTSLGACLQNKSEEDRVECIELLLQNGSALNLLSAYERSLLDKHLSSASGYSIVTKSTGNATTTDTTHVTSNTTAPPSGGSPSSSIHSASSNTFPTPTTTNNGEQNEEDINDILASIESLYIPEGNRQTKQ